jgi:hypothetical protein
MFETLLWIKNNCHPLSNSFSQADFIILSSNLDTKVSTHFLIVGGFDNIDISFTHDKAIFKLLGIGVADIDNTSIFHFIFFISSFSFTQNLCSSSTIKSHKFLNSILSHKSL